MSRMVSPFKDKNSGVYYFRMAVPKKLIPVVKKREIKISLRTKNLTEAKLAFSAQLTKAQDELELARLKISSAAERSPTVRECTVIAERWYKRMKDLMESTGDFGIILTKTPEWVDGQYHYHYKGLSDTLSIYGSEWVRATEEDYKELADDLSEHIDAQLDIEGIPVAHSNSTYIALAKAFYPYVHHLESLCKARLNSDWNYEPVSMGIYAKPLSSLSEPPTQAITAAAPQRVSANKNTIQKVLDAYIDFEKSMQNISGARLKTLDETVSKVSLFIEIIGNIDVSAVKRSDVVQFRDTLFKLPKSKKASLRSQSIEKRIEITSEQQLERLSAGTVKVYLRHLSILFSYALERDLLTFNPAFNVKVKKTVDKSRIKEDRGYTEEEIASAFSDDLFINRDAKKPYGMGCYWVPLLCRYTGARINEIAQLVVVNKTRTPF